MWACECGGNDSDNPWHRGGCQPLQADNLQFVQGGFAVYHVDLRGKASSSGLAEKTFTC